mmetsp:Transcript_20253/g.47449  ORF Transcript_20253/g.47449 Transcript_20253/m.47449 type:complete len:122 (-) Transcript_20253:170-535(-)
MFGSSMKWRKQAWRLAATARGRRRTRFQRAVAVGAVAVACRPRYSWRKRIESNRMNNLAHSRGSGDSRKTHYYRKHKNSLTIDYTKRAFVGEAMMGTYASDCMRWIWNKLSCSWFFVSLDA